MHTLHSALIAPQLLLGCMKWRVTVTPSVKLRYDVIYLIHFYETSILFSQLFASRNYGHYADTFTFDSFCYEAFISSSLPSEQEAMMEATAWQKCWSTILWLTSGFQSASSPPPATNMPWASCLRRLPTTVFDNFAFNFHVQQKYKETWTSHKLGHFFRYKHFP